MVASLGIGCGVFVHAGRRLRFAALLAASATAAYLVVKLVGAAYAVAGDWPAARPDGGLGPRGATTSALPWWRIFRQGAS